MASLELSDIQSCLFQEYKEMGCSRYYLVQVKDATLTKKFLASVADSVTHANATNNETSLNIGFTSQMKKTCILFPVSSEKEW
ncbi:MAG: hypothetical protein E6H08_16430 [Bacteroidetes bacterium]|nr:MAG: hypothetical protein E6H08_16430 [Bacteroidota bacterium]